jgi:hypothetical protein
MEDELLHVLYHGLIADARDCVRGRCKFSDQVIGFIYLLAVAHDRSPRWAIDPRHWPLWLRRVLRPPSYSQLMRRLRTPSVRRYLNQLNEQWRDRLPRQLGKCCDGKPLVVGGFSKDPDAAWGKVPDSWAKGYKLHMIVDSLGAIEAFRVTPLNTAEAKVARVLVRRMPLKQAIIRADAGYDSNALYAAVARRGGRFIAPRRKRGRGLGHHPQHPDRLRAIAELESNPQGLKTHRRLRVCVEQRLAHLTNLPFGLAPLPNFVRRLRRVRLWVLGKIILYHVHRNLSLLNAQAA